MFSGSAPVILLRLPLQPFAHDALRPFGDVGHGTADHGRVRQLEARPPRLSAVLRRDGGPAFLSFWPLRHPLRRRHQRLHRRPVAESGTSIWWSAKEARKLGRVNTGVQAVLHGRCHVAVRCSLCWPGVRRFDVVDESGELVASAGRRKDRRAAAAAAWGRSALSQSGHASRQAGSAGCGGAEEAHRFAGRRPDQRAARGRSRRHWPIRPRPRASPALFGVGHGAAAAAAPPPAAPGRPRRIAWRPPLRERRRRRLHRSARCRAVTAPPPAPPPAPAPAGRKRRAWPPPSSAASRTRRRLPARPRRRAAAAAAPRLRPAAPAPAATALAAGDIRTAAARFAGCAAAAPGRCRSTAARTACPGVPVVQRHRRPGAGQAATVVFLEGASQPAGTGGRRGEGVRRQARQRRDRRHRLRRRRLQRPGRTIRRAHPRLVARPGDGRCAKRPACRRNAIRVECEASGRGASLRLVQ